MRMGNVWHPGACKYRKAPKQQQQHVSWRCRKDFFSARTQALHLTIPMKAALIEVHRGSALWPQMPLKETTFCLSNTNIVLQLWLAIHCILLVVYFGVHLIYRMKLFSLFTSFNIFWKCLNKQFAFRTPASLICWSWEDFIHISRGK